MSDLYLVFKNLFRKKLRATLLMTAIFIAFLIYGVLASLIHGLNTRPANSGAERMVTINRVNFTNTIPIAYFNRIRAMEGVALATHQSWFGGYFQEPKNFLVTFAVDPESFFQTYDDRFELPEAERRDFLTNRVGLLVGKAVADKYGWKVGDQVPITSNIYQRSDGSHTWTLTVSGIYTIKGANIAAGAIYLNYDYFNESRTFGKDQIGQVVFRTTSPDLNDAIAHQIDETFANAPQQTRTTTASAFNRSFLAQQGNITLIITSVVGAAFVSILLVVGNTMVMAIRERTREIAVLKTIGFPARRIFGMVLGETVLLALGGGGLGFLAAAGLVGVINKATADAGFFTLRMDASLVAQGVGMMILLGLVTGILPALNAMRINIVAGLGRT